jgi:beta-glucosidase
VSSDRQSWPAGFLWGVSTSAHQYDGNNVASDYWEIEHMDLPIFAEPSGDALNSYWLWPQDMALAAKLGFTGYRFSVEWARIEPAPGCFSIAERNRYRAMIDYCRELGLEPVVTLHHITHPAWFTRNGGWTAADAVDRFAAYVAFVAPAMQGVRWVTTINEPNILATLGPASRILTAQDPAALYRSMSATKAGSGGGVVGAATLSEPADEVVAALTRAHIAAKTVLKDSTSAAVGWTVAAQAFEMVPGFEAAWNHHSRIWEDRFLEISQDDDWVGVQSYTAQGVGPDGPAGARPGAETTQQGWEFRPDAVGIAIRHAASVASGVPIIVTENGVATSDDTRRIAYIDGALQALHGAIDDGIDVRGYFHWSFIDNFEWTDGYSTTFGLVAVDRATFERTPKPSARHLGSLARA